MTKQQQNAGTEAVAIQAGGSVVVTQGISGHELAEIVRAARGDVDSQYVVEAVTEMRHRVEKLEQKIIDRFEAGEGRAESLRDPDVQLLMVDAKKAFARSGEDTLGDTLAKIIVERSTCHDRDRLALTLNRAVEVTPNLTPQDLAVLSFAFLILNTRNHGVIDRRGFEQYLSVYVRPFLEEVKYADGSLQYLQAAGCLTLTQFASASLENWANGNYGYIFSKGFEKLQFDHRVAALEGGAIVANLLAPVESEPGRLRYGTQASSDLRTLLGAGGVPAQTIDAAVALGDEGLLKGDEMKEIITGFSSGSEFFAAWNNAMFAQVRLTGTGMAIAHANAKRVVPGFAADLRNWIK